MSYTMGVMTSTPPMPATHKPPTAAAAEARLVLLRTERESLAVRVAAFEASHREAVTTAILEDRPRPLAPDLELARRSLAGVSEDIEALTERVPKLRIIELGGQVAATVVQYESAADNTRRRVEGDLLAALVLALLLDPAGAADPLAVAASAGAAAREALRRAQVQDPPGMSRQRFMWDVASLLRRMEPDPRSNEAERKADRAAAGLADVSDSKLKPTDLPALVSRAKAIYGTIRVDLA